MKRSAVAPSSLGFIDQQNIVVMHRWPPEGGARLDDIAGRTGAPPGGRYRGAEHAGDLRRRRVTQLELGVVHSLARPGGNITRGDRAHHRPAQR
jgi:hypothetical protein